MLEAFVRDPSPDVRQSTLYRKLPNNLIEHLSNDESEEVIVELLNSQPLTETIIRSIYNRLVKLKHNPYIELGIIKNKETPADIIIDLFNAITSENFRRSDNFMKSNLVDELVKNNKLPTDLIMEAEKRNLAQPESLAANSNTPLHILDNLFNQYVNNQYHGGRNVVMQQLARNTSLSTKKLRQLSDYGFSTELAGNHSTPPDVLRNIYNSSHSWNSKDSDRELLKSNPNTPTNILNTLYQIYSNEYSNKLERTYEHLLTFAKNSGSSPEIIENIYNTISQDTEDYSKDELMDILLAISQNKSTPPQILKNIFTGNINISTIDKIKLRNNAIPLLVANISTPLSVLNMLSRSDDKKISDVARNTISEIKENKRLGVGKKMPYMKKRVPINVDEIPPEDIDTSGPWWPDMGDDYEYGDGEDNGPESK